MMVETEFTRWFATAMERRKIRQSQVAAFAGVSSAAVSRWATGKSRPDPEYVRRLAELFGEPLQKVYALAGHPAEYTPPPRQDLTPREAIIEALADLPIEVHVYDQLASAGGGQAVIIETLYVPVAATAGRRTDLVGLRVSGSSMEPELFDGDTLIIDRNATAESGDIVVATIGDEVYVKRLEKKRDGEFVLRGTDDKIVPLPPDDARIEGVVLQAVRDLRRRR